MHRYEKEIEKNEKNIAEDEEILKKLVAYREHIEFLYDSLMMQQRQSKGCRGYDQHGNGILFRRLDAGKGAA